MTRFNRTPNPHARPTPGLQKNAGPDRRQDAHRRLGIRLAGCLLTLALLTAPLSGCSMLRVLFEPLPPAPTLPSATGSNGTGITTETGTSAVTETGTVTSPTSSTSPSTATRPAATTAPPGAPGSTSTTKRPGTAATGATTATSGSQPGGTTATSAANAFEAQVNAQILAGLKSASREIVLDQALADARIPASMADATIERVFDLFQAIYYSHPEFYFLSGQANASYTLKHGTTSTLSALTLKPGFISSAVGQSVAAILERQAQMLKKAGTIANAARATGSDPQKQLRAVHDDLVHRIRYDESALAVTTLNRERSNAASGLLDGLALCQGYAASFQLVAQQLGFEVLLPTGTAEGVNHAWNLVRMGDAYYHVDVTYDDPTPDGGSQAPVDHVHFLRSDAVMRETHTWNASAYPAAREDAAAHYRLGGLTVASRSELQKRIDRFVADLPDPVSQPSQLELLYTGNDMPSLSTLEKMLTQSLEKARYRGGISYRRRVGKRVVLIEVLPA